MADQILTKRCSKCKEIKVASEFYKDLDKKDGLRSQCISCTKKYEQCYGQSPQYKIVRKLYRQSEKYKDYQKSYRQHYMQQYRQSEKYKIAVKRYQQTEKYKSGIKRRQQTEKYKAAQQRYYETVEKSSGRNKVINAINNAVQAGRLPRPDSLSCHYCGKPAKQYHHWRGYKPENVLDVVPVCTGCHNSVHKVS